MASEMKLLSQPSALGPRAPAGFLVRALASLQNGAFFAINKTIGMGQVSDLAEHGTRAAVPSFGQLDRSLACFWLELMSGEEMFYGNFYKDQRVVFRAFACHPRFIGGHLLAFLAQTFPPLM